MHSTALSIAALCTRFIGYLTQAIPNQVRRPVEFLPESIRTRVDREVTQLYGYDAFDRWLALTYALPSASPGRVVPAGCIVSTSACCVLCTVCCCMLPAECCVPSAACCNLQAACRVHA